MAWPSGGETMDQYLQLLQQRQGQMPASGGSTAAAQRPQSAPSPNAPMNAQEGPMSYLAKQAGNQALGMGRNYLDQYIQSLMRQQQPGYTAPGAYGNAPMDSTGGAGYEGMMGWGVGAGGGMDMASGLGGGGADLSMLAY